ncbi:MAG: phenylalanine--tRNA ligase subunit beta [Gemmatimonadales bacterium]|nr:phenylalanine--tRNA ligase subunit beta [Gemmatimonadales bacterium]NCG33691.1 phenylalanine--tRNA ligase subunit beta [Pseudomonadota bacterium]MBT3776103.1 phenylalanine--tRNA ligase subunit beta [Gemmatimonadales bacterium]MBT6375439.1 phenylalanine--tRNA ligase subunit beta [Gemmatimonadales bacterium]MBT6886829.1 phenylalanine--tRNA ligase subunit beta [Gemmatimonadales bacterium]
MNTSYRWLTQMVPGLTLSPEDLAEHLALRGAPVESITSPGADLRDIVMGQVVTRIQHPNADRLSLCTVDGGDGVVSVVCGAPNVEEGAWYPFAPVGAVLPGDFKIKKAKIRGEVSQGMLCSSKELGLGVEHDGILKVDGAFTAGESFVDVMGLNDATLDVEITANRGDLLSHIGVARELASEGEGRVILADIPGDPGIAPEFERNSPEIQVGAVSIRIDDADLCSRYLGAVIRGVKIGPSPAWLQERLRGAGARPINNVVDATNYVMLELGQPLHAFDLNRLDGQKIVVRRASSDETSFTTLDDEERQLTSDMLMICDGSRPIAIGGVMGGLHSEVEDDTVDILLECAMFDPKSIRATRRKLVMSTDASYRYERGVDPESMELAVSRAVALILSTAGGSLDGSVLDCSPGAFEAQTVDLRLSRIGHLLGVPFESAQVTDLLTPLGFDVTGETEGVLHVRVPGFRSYDVTREVDLIEEVARSFGYDQFPSDLGPFRPGTVPDHPLFKLEDELRRSLAASGLYETQTPAFVPEGEGDVLVSNPVTTTEPYIRRAVLPSLIRRVEYNLARGNRDVRFFEIGTSFQKTEAGAPPHEETHLAAIVTGRRAPAHWSGDSAALDLWDMKAILEDTIRRAYAGQAHASPFLEEVVPYQAGHILEVRTADGTVVGYGGVLNPEAVDAPVWAGDVLGFEIQLPGEPVANEPVVFDPMPQYPASERDLALIVPQGVASQQVANVVREMAGKHLEHLELFDVYRGEGVADEASSLAYRLRFRAKERTLKDKEIDRAVKAILGRLKEALGVEHRG